MTTIVIPLAFLVGSLIYAAAAYVATCQPLQRRRWRRRVKADALRQIDEIMGR